METIRAMLKISNPKPRGGLPLGSAFPKGLLACGGPARRIQLPCVWKRPSSYAVDVVQRQTGAAA